MHAIEIDLKHIIFLGNVCMDVLVILGDDKLVPKTKIMSSMLL
jgi:hypothetical protein